MRIHSLASLTRSKIIAITDGLGGVFREQLVHRHELAVEETLHAAALQRRGLVRVVGGVGEDKTESGGLRLVEILLLAVAERRDADLIARCGVAPSMPSLPSTRIMSSIRIDSSASTSMA